MEFYGRDLRLTAMTDAYYAERIYVYLDDMTFHGNDAIGKVCRGNSYEELYQMLRGSLCEENEPGQLDEFMASSILKQYFDPEDKVEAKHFIMMWHMPDGAIQERTVEISKLPFVVDGKKIVDLAFKDVTESTEILKDALKQAESASKAKGSFLSNMSHEIRTPLNAMIGYLTIAKDAEDDREKVDHCITNSEIAARHLLSIINDVLDMSSIENGKMKIANEEFDFKKEITDLTTIFYQNAKQKGVKFETYVDQLTEEWMMGDQLRLNQILMNLLSNAVKFTPEDGLVTLGIHQIREDAEKLYLQFVVTDTGIGMSEEYMARLFRPFEQESATTAQKYGGSGLGLSITNNLIAMMGGTIAVKSVLQEGTTFTVTMHFEKTKEHQTAVPKTSDYSGRR